MSRVRRICSTVAAYRGCRMFYYVFKCNIWRGVCQPGWGRGGENSPETSPKEKKETRRRVWSLCLELHPAIGCKAISDWTRESAQSTTRAEGERFDNSVPCSDQHPSLPAHLPSQRNIFMNILFLSGQRRNLLERDPSFANFPARGWWRAIKGSIHERPLQLKSRIRKRERERERLVCSWRGGGRLSHRSILFVHPRLRQRSKLRLVTPEIIRSAPPSFGISSARLLPSELAHPFLHGANGLSTDSHRTED